MVCRSISWFISIFVAVVVATDDSALNSITGSDPEVTDHCLKTDNTGCNAEVTVHRLKTDNTETSTMEATGYVKETTTMNLAALLDATEGSMVTLVAGQTQLAAHRAVLAARSPVFEAMFRHDTPEASSGHVTVSDVEGPVLREMLAYMYTLQAPQLPDMAPQLLVAADRYGLPGLKSACEQQVAEQLTVENAAATALLALRHSCPGLTQAAVAFIKAHGKQVVMTQGWMDAVVREPDSVDELIRLMAEPPEESRTPATAGGRETPGTHRQPHSGRCRQTPAAAAAAPPTARHHTLPHDDPTAPPGWLVPGLELLLKLNETIHAYKKGDMVEVVKLLADALGFSWIIYGSLLIKGWAEFVQVVGTDPYDNALVLVLRSPLACVMLFLKYLVRFYGTAVVVWNIPMLWHLMQHPPNAHIFFLFIYLFIYFCSKCLIVWITSLRTLCVRFVRF